MIQAEEIETEIRCDDPRSAEPAHRRYRSAHLLFLEKSFSILRADERAADKSFIVVARLDIESVHPRYPLFEHGRREDFIFFILCNKLHPRIFLGTSSRQLPRLPLSNNLLF